MFLDLSTRSIEVVLVGNPTTNQLPIVVSFADHSPSAIALSGTSLQTNGTTAVVVVAPPSSSLQRQVKEINIFNADTADSTVIVRLNDNSTIRTIKRVPLSPNETLFYRDSVGWSVADDNGAIKHLSLAGDVVDNVGQNQGSGEGVYAGKSGTNLLFRSVLAGTNITLTSGTNFIQISSSGGSGETNTASNLGSGEGLFAQKSGVDLQFRSLQAGSNITLFSGTNFIQVSASSPGETNTASNVGSGVGTFLDKNGVDLRFKSLVGSNITITDQGTTIGLTSSAPGETNTASNLGSGQGIFANKAGVDLRFRSLTASGSVSLISGTNEINISASIGETNTATNLGSGEGVFAQKSSVDLQFRSLLAGTNITLLSGTNFIQISSSGGSGETNTASNLGSGEGLFAQKSGVDLQFRSLQAGANVSLTSGTNFVQISASAPGETNTATNLGSGQGWFAQKSGVDLQFRSLLAGANITLLSGTNFVQVSASNPGETNTASNVGSGVGSFLDKNGVDLRFKSLVGSNITITDQGTTIGLTGSAGSGEANTASNLGSGEGLFAQKSGVDLQFRSIQAGSNITLLSGTNFLQISASLPGGAGDVVGPGSSTDNAIARFDGTTGKTIQNSAATIDDNGNFDNAQGTINGRRHYGALGANPVSPAPSAGDCYYNLGLQMEMMYDGSRSKWLSVETMIFGFGTTGSCNAGVYHRGLGNVTFSATRGYCMFFSGTIIGMGITRDDTDACVLEAMVNGVQRSFLSSSATASFNSSLNNDFPGAVVGYTLSFRNQLTNGNQVSNAHGWAKVKWRV